jgi:hypothetical protein
LNRSGSAEEWIGSTSPETPIKGIGKLRALRELLHFKIQQRRAGIQIGDVPWLDEAAGQAFLQMIRDARNYLEYGSGGSTVLAARLNRSFISVDTDRYLLNAVRKKVGPLAPNQHLEHVKIGWTKIYGYPVFTSPSAGNRKRWKAYLETPWRFVEQGALPDLVLIDGRFRVAAALTSCVHLTDSQDSRILVDDYIMRPYYHVIESYAQLVEIQGRMAIFKPPVTLPADIQEAIDRYLIDCR